jgi:hypothetical protein
MSKITVITDKKGGIIAIGHGHLSEKTAGKAAGKEVQCGLRAGPDQSLQEIDLAQDVSQLKDWTELHAKVQPHVTHAA